MPQYERLLKNPKQFRALTGITPEKFEWLFKQIIPLYEEANRKRLSKKERKRAIGAGRKFQTVLADRLLMTLIYYRTYISHKFVGFLFQIDDSTVSRQIRVIEPLLAGIFRIPEKKVELTEDEIARIFFDGTEQPINRPKNKKKQKDNYSGKKKRHTIKHQVTTAKKKKKPGPGKGKSKKKRKVRITSVSKSFPGKVHDKKIYDQVKVKKPPGSKGIGDTGYLGTDLTTPHKKPKGRKLTKRQKKYNRNLSSDRVNVEHGIGKMKIWRIAKDKYRNKLNKHTLMFKNVAGLQNMMFA